MKLKKTNNQQIFFKKMFFSFLSAVFLTALILVSSLSINYINMALNLIYKFNDQLLAQTNYSMVYIDDLAKRLSNTLYVDDQITAFLNSDSDDVMVTIRALQRVQKHILPLNYVESIYLYNANRDLIISSKTGELVSSENFYDKDMVTYIKTNTRNTSAPLYHVVEKEQKKSLCSYVIFDTNSQNPDLLNAIVINVDASVLTKSIQEITKYQNENNSEYIIIDEKGNLLESTIRLTDNEKEVLLKSISPVLTDNESTGISSVKIRDTNYMLSLNNNNDNNWYILGLTPKNQVFSDVFHTTGWILIFVLIIILFAAIVIYLISQRLYIPVRNITQIAMAQTGGTLSSQKGKDEFQYLMSVFQSIQKQNEQFSLFKRETADSARQNFINSMLVENNLLSSDKLKQRLELLNLSHLLESPLCMVLLKIDRYNEFYTANNQKERWAMRYAILNIASEVSEKYFSCEIFSRNSDKFIILVKISKDTPFTDVQKKIEPMLADIQKNIHLIHLTVSAAYSTVFNGLDHLPGIYANLEDMIKMKMTYGHESIISPYMADEMNTDSFQRPSQESILIEEICSGQLEEAKELYQEILNQLSEYNYEEIFSYILHLAYSVCLAVQSKKPAARQEATERYKKFVTSIESCEVFSDVRILVDKYLNDLCKISKKVIENLDLVNEEAVAQKICDIIEKNYSRKDLCLSMIAEEINLTSNYAGQLFKQVQHISVSKYILELRLEKMGYYLRTTSLSSSEIIDKIGLEKNNYLYTCFKKHFGLSLSEYKMKYGYHPQDIK